MTQDEADKVAEVVRWCDDGCRECVAGMCDGLTESGLGFVWSIKPGKGFPPNVVAEPVVES